MLRKAKLRLRWCPRGSISPKGFQDTKNQIWWDGLVGRVDANAPPSPSQSDQNDPRSAPWMAKQLPTRRHMEKRNCQNYTGFSPIFEASGPPCASGLATLMLRNAKLRLRWCQRNSRSYKPIRNTKNCNSGGIGWGGVGANAPPLSNENEPICGSCMENNHPNYKNTVKRNC